MSSNPKFIVKVYCLLDAKEDSGMYWTLSGSTIDVKKAYVFTDETVPDFFKGSLEQPYVEKIHI